VTLRTKKGEEPVQYFGSLREQTAPFRGKRYSLHLEDPIMAESKRRKVTFEAKIFEGHKSLIAFHLPFEPAKIWGNQARYFVRGTVNRCPIEGEIGLRRGYHYMLLPDELLKAARVSVGDNPTFALELRTPAPEEIADRPVLTWARLGRKRGS
jgi:hypothetical protein